MNRIASTPYYRSPAHEESLSCLRSSLRKEPVATKSKSISDLIEDDAYWLGIAFEDTSDFIKPDAQTAIPKFASDEVVVGELIGTGAFNLIYNLKSTSLHDIQKCCDCDELDQAEQRQELARRILHSQNREVNDNQHHYVVKILKPNLEKDKLKKGAVHLVREAKMLANMHHPNIISLLGQGDFRKDSTRFFLILERLEETLLERMDRMRKVQRFGVLSKIFPTKKRPADAQISCKDPITCFQKRLQILLDLAAPLDYLHTTLNVCYRDLKPENIAFTGDGTLKLIDFGLAKELNKYKKISSTSSLYHVGSFAGTHPYVSPELARGEPYGVSADTYSFSIVCMEVLTLREPFADLLETEYIHKVVHGTRRPKIPRTSGGKNVWTRDLKDLLTQCWDPDPEIRPSMEEVASRLKQVRPLATSFEEWMK